ncbi:DUF2891 domain-containing protein [Sphingomonas lycopersici]|uniref:DUF2891 domain-containing protein n=1 Tax=Sphingomonas lycopersici TaxID=2951807 RepID=A0AA41ZB22_9SPHN|nr:DUF2891 domain-containing protein [Sphingomonas lycopersici]MCW6536785.1 DUF2891 domain-containing protein [Sphingomonas lycopersici]
MTYDLTADHAARFARIALGHVTREYPHKADHVMTGDADVYTPRAVHPIFYGSFDWHSCVHGYWLLARVRRLFPDLAEAAAIDALFADAFTPAKVEAERAYLDRPSARGFERPYGWAWLLMLAAELVQAGSPHAATLRPLADAFVARFRDFLPLLTYPVRAGQHANTGFALVLAVRYAEVAGDTALRGLLTERAHGWFGADRDAQAWEPSGEDFLSPILMEATAMAALLPRAAFARWFAAFLPRVAAREPAALFTPATVSDRSDGKIAHLDGLNLSRAWAFHSLAAAIDAPETQAILRDAADRHLAASLDAVAGDYMGEHWLASFALLALGDRPALS